MNSADTHATTPPRKVQGQREDRGPRVWLLVAVVWLLLLAVPLGTLLRTEPSVGRLLSGLALLAAFGGLYLWLALHDPFRDLTRTPTVLRQRILLLALLTALGLALYRVIGPGMPPGILSMRPSPPGSPCRRARHSGRWR
jgi:hypothetical protein